MSTSMDRLKVTVPFYPVQFLKDIKQSTFIPCDMKRARKFYSAYGVDKSDDAEIFQIKAKNLLSSVQYHLDRLGIPFWLSSGTCLGRCVIFHLFRTLPPGQSKRLFLNSD